METGATLFLIDNFQKANHSAKLATLGLTLTLVRLLLLLYQIGIYTAFCLRSQFVLLCRKIIIEIGRTFFVILRTSPATHHSFQQSFFRNSLPGTELLQSPFRTEFSMGLLSRRHHQSLLRYSLSLQ